MFRADLARRIGEFELDVTLEAESGTTLVLVGESGSGKTSVLRVLAGLDRPDRGSITVDGESWLGEGRARPAWQRTTGFVFQDYALFPHLSVFENVAFGLRARGERGTAVTRRVGAVLERFGLAFLAARRPAALSGGQQQRVALVRALVLEPRLLLLDEPLSALDLLTRRQVRQELRQVLGELSCVSVLVTHSPVEALLFGDRVAVLERGRALQLGSREDLLLRPRSAYVADFMGVNLFQGRIVERLDAGLARFATSGGSIIVVDPGEESGDFFVSVSPREITLSREPPEGSARNVFPGIVRELIPEPPHGERVRVALATRPPMVAEVTRPAVAGLRLEPGTPVFAAFKASGVVPYR